MKLVLGIDACLFVVVFPFCGFSYTVDYKINLFSWPCDSNTLPINNSGPIYYETPAIFLAK
jgi:hypothetical protein